MPCKLPTGGYLEFGLRRSPVVLASYKRKVRMAANLNNTKNEICELQADKYKNIREFFKYLKIKAKFKKNARENLV